MFSSGLNAQRFHSCGKKKNSAFPSSLQTVSERGEEEAPGKGLKQTLEQVMEQEEAPCTSGLKQVLEQALCRVAAQEWRLRFLGDG